MSGKIFSCKEALAFGWREFWVRPWFWLGILLVFGAILLLNILADRIMPKGSVAQGMIVAGLFMLLNQFLMAGWIRICLNIHDHQPFTFRTLFSSFTDGCRIFLTALYLAVGLVLPAFVTYTMFRLFFDGNRMVMNTVMVLLFVAGTYVMARVLFYALLIVDRGMGAAAALNTCFEMTRGHVRTVYCFWLLTILVQMLGALSLLLGLVVTIPLVLLAKVFVYRKLSAQHYSAVVPSEEGV